MEAARHRADCGSLIGGKRMMRSNRRQTLSLFAGVAPLAFGGLSLASLTRPATGQNVSQKIETRIGTLEFTHDFANGYPTDKTLEKLYDERDFQRACQAYLWAIPAVSFGAWKRG